MCLPHPAPPQFAVLPDSVILKLVDPLIRGRFSRTLTTEWLPDCRLGPLLYRGSGVGMTPLAFHTRCGINVYKGPTLTLVSVVRVGRHYVFGGYTSEPWGTGGVDIRCPSAFLFSVVGPECTVTRFPLQAKSTFAIQGYNSRGPCFGPDLVIRSKPLFVEAPFDGTSSSSLGTWYEDVVNAGRGPEDAKVPPLCGSATFRPLEVEVYAVEPTKV